jgi:hypothetical protein
MDLRKILLKVLYCVAVLVVSLALVLLLIMLFESLDDSSVQQGSGAATQASALLRL